MILGLVHDWVCHITRWISGYHVVRQTQVAIVFRSVLVHRFAGGLPKQVNHWLGIRTNKTGQMSQLNLSTKSAYPLVIKHGNGKSPVNGSFNRQISYKWSIFQPAMFDYRRVPPRVTWELLLEYPTRHETPVAGTISRTETASPLRSIWPPAGATSRF